MARMFSHAPWDRSQSSRCSTFSAALLVEGPMAVLAGRDTLEPVWSAGQGPARILPRRKCAWPICSRTALLKRSIQRIWQRCRPAERQVHVLAGLPLLIVLMIGRILPAMGQQLAPRAYAIAPINSTALILGFSYLDGGLQFQGGAPITGATAKVDLPALGLYRTFSLFGRAASATFDVPYGIGQFRGTVLELPRHLALSGFLDASLRVSVNLLGGPAMTAWEFAHWQQTTLVGASLTVVGPTGQYDPTRLVNFGSNRWAFKVELGYSRRWRHWLFDAYGGGWFFTTDPEYFSHNQYFPGTRSQSETPIGSLEAHVSYDLMPRLWVSFDADYWWGGETGINGVISEGTNQNNSRIGLTASVPLSNHQSIKLSVAEGAYIRYGGNYRSVSLAWQYAWLE